MVFELSPYIVLREETRERASHSYDHVLPMLRTLQTFRFDLISIWADRGLIGKGADKYG